jgi:hypothetical protein
VRDWLLSNAKWACTIFSFFDGKNKLQWVDDDVHFVQDQHSELDFYSATKCSSLKQEFMDRHVVPLWHIILIQYQPCSYSLLILHDLLRSSKNQFHSLWFDTNRTRTHDLHDKQGSNPRSTQLDHDVNMLTITPRQFTTDEIPHACSYHHNMDNIIILHVQVCHGLFCGQWVHLTWAVIVCFVDIGRINHHRCLNFLFISNCI